MRPAGGIDEGSRSGSDAPRQPRTHCQYALSARCGPVASPRTTESPARGVNQWLTTPPPARLTRARAAGADERGRARKPENFATPHAGTAECFVAGGPALESRRTTATPTTAGTARARTGTGWDLSPNPGSTHISHESFYLLIGGARCGSPTGGTTHTPRARRARRMRPDRHGPPTDAARAEE